MSTTLDPRMKLLLTNLDCAFDHSSFHGATLKGALRGLKAETATWKPGPARNSIWELILHAAYWKYIVRRHLTGQTSTRFPRSPSNFPRLPEAHTQAGLKKDIQLLGAEHQQLRDAIAAFPANDLERTARPRSPTPESLILGIAAHDLYHTGQILLLKRLHAEEAAG